MSRLWQMDGRKVENRAVLYVGDQKSQLGQKDKHNERNNMNRGLLGLGGDGGGAVSSRYFDLLN